MIWIDWETIFKRCSFIANPLSTDRCFIWFDCMDSLDFDATELFIVLVCISLSLSVTVCQMKNKLKSIYYGQWSHTIHCVIVFFFPAFIMSYVSNMKWMKSLERERERWWQTIKCRCVNLANVHYAMAWISGQCKSDNLHLKCKNSEFCIKQFCG